MLGRFFLRAVVVGGTLSAGSSDGPPTLTVAGELLDAADLDQLERVEIQLSSSGSSFSAPLLRGPHGSGVIRIDGDPAGRIGDGEPATIMAWSLADRSELATVRARVVVLGDGNRIVEVRTLALADDRG